MASGAKARVIILSFEQYLILEKCYIEVKNYNYSERLINTMLLNHKHIYFQKFKITKCDPSVYHKKVMLAMLEPEVIHIPYSPAVIKKKKNCL